MRFLPMHLLHSLRNTFNEIFCNNIVKEWHKNKNPYVLYKIVDSYNSAKEEFYKIQCINTKGILAISIQDLVFDISILHGLHPVQGCFIGIEYAKISRMINNGLQRKTKELLLTPSQCRYGTFNLLYQNREGFLGFENMTNNEQLLMDPRDIALSKELIEEFDVTQAFCIGIHAGLKFDYTAKPIISIQNGQFKHLRLVKS